MADWLQYSLADFLLFSPTAYWRLFEQLNAALWPLQPLALAMLTAVAVATVAMAGLSAQASAMDCDEIHLGAAISLTGKYATNGIHAQNGYDFAIKKIKEKMGKKVAVESVCERRKFQRSLRK